MGTKRYSVYLPTDLYEEFARLYPAHGGRQEIVRRIIRRLVALMKERISGSAVGETDQDLIRKVTKETIDKFIP